MSTLPTTFDCIVPCDHPSVDHGQDMRDAWERIGIPPHYAQFTLETYPRPIPPALDPDNDENWLGRLSRSELPDGLLLRGPQGAGKSGLVVGLLRYVLHAQHLTDIHWANVSQLLRQEKASWDDRGAASPLEMATEHDLLVLDDLGLAYKPSDWAAHRISALIAYRHEQELPTVITTNHTLPEIARVHGKPIASRLVEMCEIVHVDGPDLRLPQP